MSNTDKWFLLVQYRRAGHTSVFVYEDHAAATNAYSEAEREHRAKMTGPDPEMDVLLVGASDIKVVQDRYPSYFEKERSRSAKLHRLLDTLPSIEDSALAMPR